MIAAMMRLVISPLAEWWTPVVIGVAAINGLIAALFLIRRSVVAVGTFPQLVSCLPTMIGFGLAVRLAPTPLGWPWYAHALFATGVLMTIGAFLSLGTSFGVLPALRAVVVRGPYRLIRHPAYLGELMMALACFVAGPSMWALSAWLLLFPGVMWRILAEERVLSRHDAYGEYRRRVCWRLVPGLW
jgi:protein-S-isoprenylcysteine O-methyltransferase Ste14